MAYAFGKSNKPRLTYAVARVLMGLDPALANDPEDALNVSEALPEDQDAPTFGADCRRNRAFRETSVGGVPEYVAWFLDDDPSAFESP
jgi:hypothetical protein